MADEPTPEPTPEPEPEPTQDPDSGAKKALEAERKARRDAERRLKEIEDRDKSELQKAQDELKERDALLADLPKQARQQAIRFASQATQAGFLDPEDALLNIGDSIDMADTEAVKAALDDLAERKPHLVRPDRKNPPKRPKPGDGEPAGGAPAGEGKARAAEALRLMRN